MTKNCYHMTKPISNRESLFNDLYLFKFIIELACSQHLTQMLWLLPWALSPAHAHITTMWCPQTMAKLFYK